MEIRNPFSKPFQTGPKYLTWPGDVARAQAELDQLMQVVLKKLCSEKSWRWRWLNFEMHMFSGLGLGCPPSQDASHHQDYYIFSRGFL